MERYLITGSKETQEYTFDRYIFLFYILAVLIVAVALIIILGGFDANKYLYVECKTSNNSWCLNPLYNNTNYCGKTIMWDEIACNQEFIPNGFSMGKKPPAILEIWGTVVFVGLLIMFIINHLIYNRKFNFKKWYDETGKIIKEE